jgi:hypothetical protein
MAGDWMPVRLDLDSVQEVRQIACRSGLPVEAVMGYLVRLWSWFNKETTDGVMASPDPCRLLSATIGQESAFWRTVADVGWLHIDEARGLIQVPNWDHWNSESAKGRLQEAMYARVRRSRKRPRKRRQMSAQSPTLVGKKTDTLSDTSHHILEDDVFSSSSSSPSSRADETSQVDDGGGGFAKTTKPSPPPVPPELRDLDLYREDAKLCARWPTLLRTWVKTYPGLDVLAEVRRAHAWEVENPTRRKVNRPAYLGQWLRREQDRPRRPTNGNGAAPVPLTIVEPAAPKVLTPFDRQQLWERAQINLAYAGKTATKEAMRAEFERLRKEKGYALES